MTTKIYSADVLNHLQKEINSGKFQMKNIETPSDLPAHVYISGAEVNIEYDEENKRYYTNLYPDFSFNKNDMHNWRLTPLGKFYHKDWNAINNGSENYKRYAILTMRVETVDVVVLVRTINADEFDSEELYKAFHHLVINGEDYTIIKAFSPSIDERFSKKSTLEDTTFQTKMLSTYGEAIIDTGDNEPKIEDIPDESASVELF